MSKPTTILWMAEELDFDLLEPARSQAKETIKAFLESAADKGLFHSIYPAEQ